MCDAWQRRRTPSHMKQTLIIGLGGFPGSILRYQLGGLVLHHSQSWRFPLSTFVVNVLGCVMIGILAGLAERRDFFSADIRLFLFTGLLGGFTTFSAFSYEGVYLLRRGEPIIAILYALSSVVIGFGAVWLAIRLLNSNTQ